RRTLPRRDHSVTEHHWSMLASLAGRLRVRLVAGYALAIQVDHGSAGIYVTDLTSGRSLARFRAGRRPSLYRRRVPRLGTEGDAVAAGDAQQPGRWRGRRPYAA